MLIGKKGEKYSRELTSRWGVVRPQQPKDFDNNSGNVQCKREALGLVRGRMVARLLELVGVPNAIDELLRGKFILSARIRG